MATIIKTLSLKSDPKIYGTEDILLCLKGKENIASRMPFLYGTAASESYCVAPGGLEYRFDFEFDDDQLTDAEIELEDCAAKSIIKGCAAKALALTIGRVEHLEDPDEQVEECNTIEVNDVDDTITINFCDEEKEDLIVELKNFGFMVQNLDGDGDPDGTYTWRSFDDDTVFTFDTTPPENLVQFDVDPRGDNLLQTGENGIYLLCENITCEGPSATTPTISGAHICSQTISYFAGTNDEGCGDITYTREIFQADGITSVSPNTEFDQAVPEVLSFLPFLNGEASELNFIIRVTMTDTCGSTTFDTPVTVPAPIRPEFVGDGCATVTGDSDAILLTYPDVTTDPEECAGTLLAERTIYQADGETIAFPITAFIPGGEETLDFDPVLDGSPTENNFVIVLEITDNTGGEVSTCAVNIADCQNPTFPECVTTSGTATAFTIDFPTPDPVSETLATYTYEILRSNGTSVAKAVEDVPGGKTVVLNMLNYQNSGDRTFIVRLRTSNDCLASTTLDCIIEVPEYTSEATTYSYTGAQQNVTKPAWATRMEVRCWGAAGGNGDFQGGEGGYARSEIAAQNCRILVGQGGLNQRSPNQSSTGLSFGFGGGIQNGSFTNGFLAGQGGGLSGVFSGSTYVSKDNKGRSIVVAGGGGGGGGGVAGTNGGNQCDTQPKLNGQNNTSGGIGPIQLGIPSGGGGGGYGGGGITGGTAACGGKSLGQTKIANRNNNDPYYGGSAGATVGLASASNRANNGRIVIRWTN